MKKKISILLLCVILCNLIFMNQGQKAQAGEFDYSLVFQADYYAEKNPDVKTAYGTDETLLLNHFIHNGMAEGRQASDSFEVYSYMGRYADLRAKYGYDLKSYYIHYMKYGKAEGRSGAYNKTYSAAGRAYYTEWKSNPTDDTLIQTYLHRSVFVGDSIMAGLRNYAQGHPNFLLAQSNFLAVNSFSLVHANHSAAEDAHQPLYMGQTMNVWDAIALMDVDHVFLMFGTNDLVCNSPQRVMNNYITLINNIRAVNPDVDIHIISMTPVYAGTHKGCLNLAGIDSLNELLQENAVVYDYSYMELNDHLRDVSGNLPAQYCSDKYVHHTNLSYSTVWANVIKNYADSKVHQAIVQAAAQK